MQQLLHKVCTTKTVSSDSHCANLQNDLVPYASWYHIGSTAKIHHSPAKQRHKLGSKRSRRLDQAVFSDAIHESSVPNEKQGSALLCPI